MTPIDLVFLAAMGVLTFVPMLYALWYFCNGRSIVPSGRPSPRRPRANTRDA